MLPLSSPLTSALCLADPDCGVRPQRNLKAGSLFPIRSQGYEKPCQASCYNHAHKQIYLLVLHTKFCICPLPIKTKLTMWSRPIV